MTSIASTLGIGSGIDTSTLIESLASATKTPKETAIKARETANTAKISALATVSNSLTTFSTALNSLIAGGTLSTQPTTSDSNVLTAKAQAGARIGNLSAQVEVTQLATAQSLVSGYVPGSNTPIGRGAITLQTGTGSKTITIGADNDSLSGLAKSINAAGVGVTASVVTDANGARLLLKGETGVASAFTLTPASDAAAGLSAFAYPATTTAGTDADGNPTTTTAGMTRAQAAQDAILKLDGVQVTRGSNTVSDLVSGITLELKGAKVGTAVSIGSARPTDAIKQAVSDVVDAYNELAGILKEQTALATSSGQTGGALQGESSIREMKRQLSQLTSTVLNSGGGPSTLAEIGVSTNRDGTLTLNSSKLQSMLASDPDGVEALFNPGQHSSSPLVEITSPMGRAKAGTYTITNVTAQTSGASAAGTIAGTAAITTGETLVASVTSKASGLVLKPLGTVLSATITVDQGIAGALQGIKSALLDTDGALASAKTRLTKETSTIASDRTKMEDADASYRARLTKSFTAMDSRVAAYKSTQSFLEQQVKVWTNDDN